MSLKNILSKAFGLDNLKYALIGLIEAKLKLKKIKFQEQLGSKLTDLIFLLITVLLSLLLLIFTSVFIAAGINVLLNSDWYGFGIVAVIYLLLLILWISNEQAAKQQIDKRVTEGIDKKMSNLKIPK
jgi:protein-S-isoprenylcysteine O-methyltransferase Ste14